MSESDNFWKNFFATKDTIHLPGKEPGIWQKLYSIIKGESMKRKVLFVCIHNSARSQMAEAWLKHLCGDYFDVQSAGLEPGVLNPLVVEVMKEAGIDISHKKTQGVFDLLKQGAFFNYVIAVCDEASAERCPIFSGASERLRWSFPDPSKLGGTKDEKLGQIRIIRDTIKDKIKDWCSTIYECSVK